MSSPIPGGTGDLPIRGIVMMVLAVGLWSLHDAISKWLAESYPVPVVLFWRSQFGLIAVMIVAWRFGGIQRLSGRLMQLCSLRGLFGFCSFSTFMFALPLMEFANAAAVGMSAPIFLTAFSIVFLGEQVGMRRWSAILVGFAAVLFIVRPGGDIAPLGAILMMIANVFYATSMMMTRRLGRTVSTATLAFYTALAFAVSSALLVTTAWMTPDWEDMAVFVAIGAMAGVAQYMMTEAFRVAPVATVAPFEYSGMVWAVLLGLAFWGDLPSWEVVAGVAVIIGSGLYILRRERVKRER